MSNLARRAISANNKLEARDLCSIAQLEDDFPISAPPGTINPCPPTNLLRRNGTQQDCSDICPIYLWGITSLPEVENLLKVLGTQNVKCAAAPSSVLLE